MFNSIKSWLLVTSIILNCILALGLYVYFGKAAQEQQNRLAMEEVYHNLVIEANKIKSETKVVTRYIEKPDGTKITEKIDTEKKTEESTKVSEEKSEKSIVKVEGSPRSQYSVTVLGPLKVGSPYDYDQIGVYLGYRILGPFEAIIGGKPAERSAEIGLRFEW